MEDIKPLNNLEENPVPEAPVTEGKKINKQLILIGVAVVFVGLLTGWGVNQLQSSGKMVSGGGTTATLTDGEKIVAGKTYGRTDEQFKDSAKGTLGRNDEATEGTHKLLRTGGESQTAYLTSSVLDLDLFVGHEVEIWGETFAGQEAGWLLDVGAVKVLK